MSKLVVLKPLGLALSEKQIPQIIENTKKCGELKEPLEPDGMRPRQGFARNSGQVLSGQTISYIKVGRTGLSSGSSRSGLRSTYSFRIRLIFVVMRHFR